MPFSDYHRLNVLVFWGMIYSSGIEALCHSFWGRQREGWAWLNPAMGFGNSERGRCETRTTSFTVRTEAIVAAVCRLLLVGARVDCILVRIVSKRRCGGQDVVVTIIKKMRCCWIITSDVLQRVRDW